MAYQVGFKCKPRYCGMYTKDQTIKEINSHITTHEISMGPCKDRTIKRMCEHTKMD